MRLVAVLLTVLLLGTAPGVAADPSPVGIWRTFDDDGKETGRIEITEQNNLLYGRIVAIADPAKAKAVCRDCTDERRNQPVLGMVVMNGLHREDDGWTGGHILDPQNGSTYRCSLSLGDGGRKLVVRGYLGISLFGRSQTWTRAQ
jgi:uncharacterized protein (DUF2147 family)